MWRHLEIRNFLRAPWRGKMLALEAAWQLARARVDTCRPAAHYTGLFGHPDGEQAQTTPEQEALADRIGAIVARTALWMPFKAQCLQQVLALRRMLDRRKVPAVVYLGVEHGDAAQAERRAHAWVRVGGRVVNGNLELERYAVVGVFS